jgi:hypothetical protein
MSLYLKGTGFSPYVNNSNIIWALAPEVLLQRS